MAGIFNRLKLVDLGDVDTNVFSYDLLTITSGHI